MKGQVHTAQRHDSALKHVTGQALYIDDVAEPPGTLHAALVLSPIASGRLRKLDLSMAAASLLIASSRVTWGPFSMAQETSFSMVWASGISE